MEKARGAAAFFAKKWRLGFDWGDRLFYGSDYFEKTYELAEDLIKKGLAYVCELTPEEFKEYRGDVNTPARSPSRTGAGGPHTPGSTGSG